MSPSGTIAQLFQSSRNLRRASWQHSEHAGSAGLRGMGTEDGEASFGEALLSGLGCVGTSASTWRSRAETFPARQPFSPASLTAGS